MLSHETRSKFRGEKIKQDAEGMLNQVYDSLQEQFDVLQDYYEDTRQATKEATKKVKVFVEQHPFYSTLGAIVIGVALGLSARGSREKIRHH